MQFFVLFQKNELFLKFFCFKTDYTFNTSDLVFLILFRSSS